MTDFLIYAAAAGVMVAVMAGALGTFVIWQRLAYFGDTLAHSALLGIAIGLMLEINTTLATTISCLFLAALLVLLERGKRLNNDALLGILSHGSLAIGLVAVSLSDSTRLDLNAYLFGDLLAVGPRDLMVIATTLAVITVTLLCHWNGLLNLTINEELAAVEGYRVLYLKMVLMLMIALLVAIAMKIIGVLLITALLIIPAACARRFATTPEQMALGATVVGALSVLAGLAGSYHWDTPAGPSVVVAATVIFALTQLLPRKRS